MANAMLTTIDNPYDPFTHFDEWYAYDELKAMEENRPTCCSYLARMSFESDDISEKELEEVNEAVIDDICQLNLTGKFVKVTQKQEENDTRKMEDG